MSGYRQGIWLICLAAILSLPRSVSSADENPSQITIEPDQIKVGTFYDGCDVLVSATVTSCDGAVIVLEGKEQEVTLNRKGRVAVIWMNVARITVGGLPEVYILAASDSLDNICSEVTLQELELGLNSLRSKIKVSSDHPLTGDEFEQFLKLKEYGGTYDTDIKIDLKSISPDRQVITAVLPIPSGMPPGSYDIKLYCFSQGNLIGKQVGRLEIKSIGLPCLLMNLAEGHAAVYGILAIFVAMAAGLIIGIISNILSGRGNRY
jgi:uncharacterized protein (TIGR02186 family)